MVLLAAYKFAIEPALLFPFGKKHLNIFIPVSPTSFVVLLFNLPIPLLDNLSVISAIDFCKSKINDDTFPLLSVVEEVVRFDISVVDSQFFQTVYSFQEFQHVMFHFGQVLQAIEKLLSYQSITM